MGSGKTTTGQALARKLGWTFVDLDQEIRDGEGQSIAEIFRKLGEPHLRELEHKYLKELLLTSRQVVALGGGAFMSSEIRALAEQDGLTVWLKVSFANVVQRVRMDGTRPMFMSKEQAEHLYGIRQPLYGHAMVHILTDEKSPEAVAEEILGAIRTI
jgi:shikimate kinase